MGMMGVKPMEGLKEVRPTNNLGEENHGGNREETHILAEHNIVATIKRSSESNTISTDHREEGEEWDAQASLAIFAEASAKQEKVSDLALTSSIVETEQALAATTDGKAISYNNDGLLTLDAPILQPEIRRNLPA